MNRPLLYGLLGFLALAALAYPLHQAAATGGYVYYANGLDEFTYLQYDFSRATQGLTRPGQFLVTLAHELGLSGGWFNLLADLLAIAIFPLLVRAIALRAGWSAGRANAGALLLLLLPMIVSGANPAIAWLHAKNTASGLIYWFNLPHTHTPAILRSPEPQLSFLLFAAGVLAALRLRRFWPAYACLPFMYPFVAMPAGFVVLACHLKAAWRRSWRWPSAGPLVLAGLAVGAAAWAYHAWLVAAPLRDLLVQSHLPLVSFTAAIALAAYALLRPWIDESHRFVALAAALAPLVASNQQLLSGHLVQPENVEMYFGGLAVAFVLALALADRPRWRIVAAAVCAVLFLRSSYVVFRTNQLANDRLPLTPALVAALKEAPGEVVVNDLPLAWALGLVHPRQEATALSLSRTYTALADRTAPQYRCVKHAVQRAHADAPGIPLLLAFLDESYAYGGQKNTNVSILRKQAFKKLQNVEATPCDGRRLRCFFVGPGHQAPAPETR